MVNVNDIKLTTRLVSYAKPYGHLIVITILLMLIYGALLGAPVLLLQPLTDKTVGKTLDIKTMPVSKSSLNPFNVILAGKTIQQTFNLLALILLPLIVLIALFDYLKEYLYRYVTFKTVINIRNALCAHIIQMPIRFFSDRKAGDLISRVTNDVSTTQSALEFVFGDIIQQPLKIIPIFIYMILLDLRSFLIILVVLPFFIFPILRIGRKIRKSKQQSLIKLGDVTESMHQIFTGIRIVKSFRMENEEIREFAQENRGFLRKNLGVARAKSLSSAFIHLAGGVALFLALLAGGYLVKSGQLSVGTVGALIACILLLNTPVRLFAKSINVIQESMAGAERIFELMELKPEVSDETDAINLPAISQVIKFNRLSFAYENEAVLEDIDFTARAGETVAIVGPTGAGKSTLLDLVARFYDPQTGSIEIDGRDIRHIKRESLLSHIAIVGQETFLFNTTIKENIKYGKRLATDDEIINAARLAQIHDFIVGLPEGYNTEIGERGAKLSGGERQRMAIARAILKNPSILLLDEATSALDAESEHLVQNALNNLMKGRTTFVIAHRLYTVQNAHQIIVLDNGRMVQHGTHQELINQEGLYKKLYETQFGVTS